VIFFSSVKSARLNQFFCLLCIQAVSDVGPYQTIYWKIYYIDAELAGHLHKLDVKLQSLCGSGFSLFAVRILAKPYHFGVNWPTTLCENKDGVRFFTLNFECHSRYNKLLLCNSANNDIASCNKNNSDFFFLNKILFLLRKTKPVLKNRRVVLKKRVFLNPDYLSILFCDFPLIARSGTSHVTISLIGCAPHT